MLVSCLPFRPAQKHYFPGRPSCSMAFTDAAGVHRLRLQLLRFIANNCSARPSRASTLAHRSTLRLPRAPAFFRFCTPFTEIQRHLVSIGTSARVECNHDIPMAGYRFARFARLKSLLATMAILKVAELSGANGGYCLNNIARRATLIKSS